MKKLLQRLLKVVAYTAAGVVILLAIAVGLFRLFLPRLPEYQEDIKGWASAAIGMNVEFSGMDARWGLSGPEVEFYDAELISRDTMARIVAADEVRVGVGLMRLLVDRKFVVDRVIVRETALELRQLEDGGWWIQGSPPDQLIPVRRGEGTDVGQLEIVGEDVQIQFLQPGDERPRVFAVPRFTVNRDEVRTAIDAAIELPEDLGGRMTIAATQLTGESDEAPDWDVTVEIDDIVLAGVSALHTAEAASFRSGSGDIDMSLAYADGRVQSVSADVDLQNVALEGQDAFSVNGLIEFRQDLDGWLLAASRFRFESLRGAWPEGLLRIEAGTDSNGKIVMLDMSATYLNLTDIEVLTPWLPAEQKDLLASYAPDGSIRDLTATVSDVDTSAPRFDIAADFLDVGFAAIDNRPGIRGFSGRLRAERSGGRLEIDSSGLTVNSPRFLGVPAVLDEATGTIIWRRSGDRTTVLSDSILLRNADFEIESNVEVSLMDGATAPVVDLAATFSISDLSTAKRYIPFIPRIPKTSEWFQNSLLAGRIPRGTVRLYGPMDKFPFDAGEGRLLIESKLLDARIMYQPRWPVAEVIDMDVVIENTRLYSDRNNLINSGNAVSNAKIEIQDFRNPILTVKAYSTGTLEAVRRLVANSPIGTDVFGGKLERVAVTGDGAVDLDLTVPIKDIKAFEFTSRLQTSNGGLKLEGFPAPITDLSGVVTVERENIRSESLGGIFLGQPVSIELLPAPETMPEYRVIANANGAATAGALSAELGLPLDDVVTGISDYTAQLLFPRGKIEKPLPFAINIQTDLAGIATTLPAPLQKQPEEALSTSVRIELPANDERINSRGRVEDVMSWEVSFTKEGGAWDLDRGVVMLGSEATIEPAETRGLHLRGNADAVHMQDWFNLSRGRDRTTGTADRIRSVDMTVKNLHIVGQHLVNHHVRVDRSARDWLIEIDGEDILGSAIVPYDFRSGRPLVLDMERLVLPGNEEPAGGARNETDPRSLPPVSIKAKEFAFGDRFLGQLQAEFQHTADGLRSERIVSTDSTFEIVGSGGWIIDESDPLGHRSYVTASLKSSDVAKTMQRLNYDPGIVADDLSMLLDFSWSGGPQQDFMELLDGSVKVRIGTGQLDEVEPGAGRMFGLMSIVALPRRLALDFRDVFNKGFGFDKISGDFRIVDGETFTCNLTLEGPAADIAIVGRAGLVNRDYDQVAVVSANFGNTLPVVGAVVGGPQVAAVLLVFSQIFKKPLQEVTQVYYSFGGSFDEPLIEATTAASFAERAAALGCLEETG